MTDRLFVKTRMEEPVSIQAAQRIARVPAGRTWAEVVELASPLGLTALHGSARRAERETGRLMSTETTRCRWAWLYEWLYEDDLEHPPSDSGGERHSE